MRGAQQHERRCAELCIQGLQGGNQVGEKARGIVVLRFQGEPGDRGAALGTPLSQQGRFAKPGRGRDEGEGACQTLLESPDEASARDQVRARALLFPLPLRAYFSLEGTLQTILRDLLCVARAHSYRVIITSTDINVFTIQMLRYTLQSEEH